MKNEIPKIKLIFVSDNVQHKEAIEATLEKEMRFPWSFLYYENIDKAVMHLDNTDLIILDLESQGFVQPKEIFEEIDSRVFEVPIIALTGEDEHELAVYLMEKGAADTLIRGQFLRLVDAIEFALIRQKIGTKVRETSDRAMMDNKTDSAEKLKDSEDKNKKEAEGHRQILRMFKGDYSVDS